MTHAPPPDATIESDIEFFRRRPDVDCRTRLPFEGQPPACLLERDAVAFIRVKLIERDASGWPATITREIAYGEWGHA